jgi:hypothetical protein
MKSSRTNLHPSRVQARALVAQLAAAAQRARVAAGDGSCTDGALARRWTLAKESRAIAALFDPESGHALTLGDTLALPRDLARDILMRALASLDDGDGPGADETLAHLTIRLGQSTADLMRDRLDDGVVNEHQRHADNFAAAALDRDSRVSRLREARRGRPVIEQLASRQHRAPPRQTSTGRVVSAAVLELVPDDTHSALCPECDGYGFGGPCERCDGEGDHDGRECTACDGCGTHASCENCFGTGMAESVVRVQAMVWASAPTRVTRLVMRLNDRMYAGFPAIEASGCIRVRGQFGAKARASLTSRGFKYAFGEWALQLPSPRLPKDEVAALRKRARALRKRRRS